MKRAYVQTARARSAEETGERILGAAFARFTRHWYDEVTLDQIAADAGVSVQTVIRRFGSKEGVVRALAAVKHVEIEAQRLDGPTEDVPATVANLVAHYEAEGTVVLHLLRQEERVPAFAEITDRGKQMHEEWCRRVFDPWLGARTGVARRCLLAQLVAICDVYTWDLLRHRQGLSPRQTRLALVTMLNGVLS